MPGMTVPLIHLIDGLSLGGMTRIMQSLAILANRRIFAPIMAGLKADPIFVNYLRAQGLEAGEIGEGLEQLDSYVRPGKPFVVVIHRSGERQAIWDRTIPLLRKRGATLLLNQNAFSHVDAGPVAGLLDLCMFYSKDAMRQHWKSAGRPDVDRYLEKHRVLHCAVTKAPTVDALARARLEMRGGLGIPEGAFVIGDTCRPDARKLDPLVLLSLGRIIADIPNCWFIARRYPELAERFVRGKAALRFRNLPVSQDEGDMFRTYAAMDVFVHGSTMGESFGMSIAEAMRCGLPVVANETPMENCDNAQGELVLHGETGYLVNDPLSLVHALRTFAASPSLVTQMGTAAQNRFLEAPYSPAAIIDQFEFELRRLGAQKGFAFDLGGETTDREPSDFQMRHFLSEHKRQFSVTPKGSSWRAWPWTAYVQGGRVAWRVLRKLVGEHGVVQRYGNRLRPR
jgi:glycosyltransferase involved in cell wall biosynthesis